jgi:hypothetical protein
LQQQHWFVAFTGDGNQSEIASSIRTLAVSLGFFIAIMFNLYTGMLYTRLLSAPTTSLYSDHVSEDRNKNYTFKDTVENLLTTAAAKLYIRAKDLHLSNNTLTNSSITHVKIRGIGDHVNKKAIHVTDDEAEILKVIMQYKWKMIIIKKTTGNTR